MKLKEFFSKKPVKIIYRIFLYGFAIFGFGVFGAWAVYELGLTKNNGLVDRNTRYLAKVSEIDTSNQDSTFRFRTEDYIKLVTLGRMYPHNANLIINGLRNAKNDKQLTQMLAACELYIKKIRTIRI